jgi:methyl-accepting chemotaxis protein
MNVVSTLGMALLQADAAASANDVHLIMYAMMTIAVILVLVLVALGIAAMLVIKEIQHIKGIVTDVQTKTMPIVQKAQEIVADLQPKIRTVSENFTQMTYVVREKVDEVGQTVTQVNKTVQETNQRTRGQVDHVDRIVSSALTSTEEVTHSVVHGIKVPIRQMTAVVAGLRTGIETLVKNFTPKNGAGPGGTAL